LEKLQEKLKKYKKELASTRKVAEEWRKKVEIMEEAAELQEENRGTHQDVLLVAKLHQLEKENSKLKQRLGQCTDALEIATEGKDYHQVDHLKHKLTKKETEQKELKVKLQQCLAALKHQGESAKFEQSQGILDEMTKWMNDVGFNKTKFVFSKEDVKELMTECYKGIKERIGLSDKGGDYYTSKEEFLRIYSLPGQKIFNDTHLYCQTKLQVAVFGKLTKTPMLITLNGS
jgi:hypothetical protein